MIDIVYYSPELRVYRDGRVEKYYQTKKEWKLLNNNIPNEDGYIRTKIDGKLVFLHRLSAFCFLGLDKLNSTLGGENRLMIDHINGDTSNNNIDNLRIVNNQQNQYNRNMKGYCYHKASKKWQTTIRFDNITKYLGIFNTEEEARQAYQSAKAMYHVIAT